MKKAFRFIIVFLFFFESKLVAQIPEIITKTDYTVAGSETLIASQSIILKPNTWIKSGSTFVAKISPDAYNPFTFSNENYIFSRVFQSPLATSSSIGNNSDVIESIVYYDGLGRPMQNIAIKGSPSKQDIVTHISYDNFGRREKEYLPYMDTFSSYAAYRSSAETNTIDYYKSNYSTDINALAPNPFSQKEFERSPLNRVFKQAAPGKDWSMNSGHEVKIDYIFNSIADGVKNYVVTTMLNTSGIYEPSLFSYAVYGENELYKTIVKNENWISGKNNTTEEFKDKQGKIILKRTYANYENPNQLEEKHDTYYVCDNYGNLTYVLPPKAEGATDDNTLNNLCYQYKYDTRNRLVEKKLPGKDWEYIVYDKLDRPILSQDANLKTQNKWLFTKYDAFNRPVYTGDYVNTAETTRTAIQGLVDATTVLFEVKQGANVINGTTVYYSNSAFPNINNANINLFTINYYDDYSFDLNGGTSAISYNITPIVNPKGLTTGSKVRVLGTFNWITNVNYFDTKGKPIYNYSKNDYFTTISTVKSLFDFTGRTLETTSTHLKGTNPIITVIDAFLYDHAGRLLTQKQTINNQIQEVIVENTYDNLGQLTSKGIGGKTTQNRLQTVNYNYNIRGWLNKINDVNAIGNDLFAFQVNYNQPTTGIGLYNGNISQTLWKTANDIVGNSPRNYIYTYDSLDRLTVANDNSSINTNRYNESLNYDKNGNIMSLLRMGNTDAAATTFGTMDNLIYTYDTGNKLTAVTDSSGSTEGFKTGTNYTYDKNGNILKDSGKIITTDIIYNHLNLPTQIPFNRYASSSSRTWSASLDYKYDATGNKLTKKVYKTEYLNGRFTTTINNTTDYAGGYIYENNVLKFLSQSEGYVSKNETTGNFDYIYQYKDHLGNVRLSYGDGNNDGAVNTSEIVEENNYYPFGLKHKGYNSVITGAGNATAQKYKYNGKELQDELGLNIYDYGARNYDAALGRWMNMDPLAEKYSSWSPYNFCFNNPLRFVDPTGMGPDDFVQKLDGSIYWDNNANSQATTKSGETYLGKTLTFNFNSYIDKNLWDGPMGDKPAGDKLTSTITLTGRENDKGELTSMVGTKSITVGKTPIGTAKDYYPGEGGSNNTFGLSTTKNGINVSFEQHASVSPFEEFGMNMLGYKIVDVAQKLDINYNSRNGNLSVSSYTDVFPSATLSVNGNQMMIYNQPSFVGTHTAPSIMSTYLPGQSQGRDFSYYPSKFFKR
jgi:RHS repeat-associated protein